MSVTLNFYILFIKKARNLLLISAGQHAGILRSTNKCSPHRECWISVECIYVGGDGVVKPRALDCILVDVCKRIRNVITVEAMHFDLLWI